MASPSSSSPGTSDSASIHLNSNTARLGLHNTNMDSLMQTDEAMHDVVDELPTNNSNNNHNPSHTKASSSSCSSSSSSSSWPAGSSSSAAAASSSRGGRGVAVTASDKVSKVHGEFFNSFGDLFDDDDLE
eukprot:Nk52_evm38s250 gene=Nk52_evmTU38s250